MGEKGCDPMEVDLSAVATAAYFERVNLSANGFFATPEIGFDFETQQPHPGCKGPFNYFCYGAAAAEVELDCLTGEWVCPRVDLLHDVGRSLNPAIDIGQIEGAFTQGFG